MIGPGPRSILAIALTLLVSGLLALFWGPASASVSSQAVVNVSMVDNGLRPQNLTIATGVQVVWTNNGTVPHTSTGDTGLWDSDALAPGETFRRTFDAPGTYPYHCNFHRDGGMVGVMVVQGTAPPAAPGAATPVSPPSTKPRGGAPTPTPTPAGTAVPSPTATPATPQPTPPAVLATPSPIAGPAPPAITPRPPVGVPATLPATGESETLPQWAIALAALAIAVGVAVRILARR